MQQKTIWDYLHDYGPLALAALSLWISYRNRNTDKADAAAEKAKEAQAAWNKTMEGQIAVLNNQKAACNDCVSLRPTVQGHGQELALLRREHDILVTEVHQMAADVKESAAGINRILGILTEHS